MIKSLKTALFTLAFVNSALAQEAMLQEKQNLPNASSYSRWSFGAGIETRMLKKLSADADYEHRLFPSLFVAYREKWVQSFTEFAFHENSQRVGVLNIDYQRKELRQWARYIIRDQSTWTPHLGASLGLYREEIKTRLSQDFRADTSEWEPTLGFEIGAQGILFRRMLAELNFRALRDSFDEKEEDWNWSLQVNLGYAPL